MARGGRLRWWKEHRLKRPGIDTGSNYYQLCDFREVTHLLWPSVSSFETGITTYPSHRVVIKSASLIVDIRMQQGVWHVVADLPFPHRRIWGKAGLGLCLEAAHAKNSPWLCQLVCLSGGLRSCTDEGKFTSLCHDRCPVNFKPLVVSLTLLAAKPGPQPQSSDSQTSALICMHHIVPS